MRKIGIKFTEKDAINDHSVDRFNCTIQLKNLDTDEAIVKACDWFCLVANEIDMCEQANRFKRKIAFYFYCIFRWRIFLAIEN